MSKLFSFELHYVLYNSPKKVYEALTDASIVKKWSGSKAKIELKPKGTFELFDSWAQGNVIAFEKDKSFSFTWKVTEWNKKALPSTVAITLQKHEAGTRLILEHNDLPTAEESDKHKQGWIAYVFDPINDFFIAELEKLAAQ